MFRNMREDRNIIGQRESFTINFNVVKGDIIIKQKLPEKKRSAVIKLTFEEAHNLAQYIQYAEGRTNLMRALLSRRTDSNNVAE